MNKYLSTALILISMALQAQTYKGKWLLENTFGNFNNANNNWNYSNQGYKVNVNDKIIEFGGSFNAGYFLHKRLVFGVGLQGSYAELSSNGYVEKPSVKISEGQSKSSFVYGLPFLRYYTTPDAKSTFYVQAGVGIGGYLTNKSESTQYDLNGKVVSKYAHRFNSHQILTLQGLIGLNYFFNPIVAFNMAVGMNYTKVEFIDFISSNYPVNSSNESQTFHLRSAQKIITWRAGLSLFFGKERVKKNKDTKT